MTLRERLALRLPANQPLGRIVRKVVGRVLDSLQTIDTLRRVPRDAFLIALAWHRAPLEIGEKALGDEIVMLVVSDLRVDPRVRREARQLADVGYKVTIVWPDHGSWIVDPVDWGPGIFFKPLPARAGQFAYHFPGFLAYELVKAGRAFRPFAFHAHDLNTMLAALVLGRETGAHMVADHHEWFSEHVTWSSRRGTYVTQGRISKVMNRWLEGLVHSKASRVITVCQSIADDMNSSFGGGERAVCVIRNIPSTDETTTDAGPNLRKALGVRSDQLLVLYQGGVGPSRALEPVIRALQFAQDAVLAIRGPGIEHFENHYRRIAEQIGVGERLYILQPVAQHQVVASARGADCGLYTVANLCKSFAYALPNKAFEYLAADLPVLTADYPEVHRLLVDGGVGISFDAEDPEDIGRAMKEMGDPFRRAELRSAIPALLAANRADAEWQKLAAIYDSLPRAKG